MIAFSSTAISISFNIFIVAVVLTAISTAYIESKFGQLFITIFAVISLTSCIVGVYQVHNRNTTILTEKTYYRYIINAYNKRDTLTPLEIDEYNRRLTELQIFQKQHPECISNNCDYSIQPFLTPTTEEN